MGLGVVRHLIAHARRQGEDAAILQLCVQLPLEAEQHVTLAAPVIRQVAGGVLHHPHPQLPKLLAVPAGDAAFTLVLGRRYVGPAGRAKWQCIDVHDRSFVYSRRSRGFLLSQRKIRGKTSPSLVFLYCHLVCCDPNNNHHRLRDQK